MTTEAHRASLAAVPSQHGAGGACGLHGVYDGFGCPTCAATSITVRMSRGRVPYRCPICGGRGMMPHGFYYRLGASNATGPDQCRTCLGTGIVYG